MNFDTYSYMHHCQGIGQLHHPPKSLCALLPFQALTTPDLISSPIV